MSSKKHVRIIVDEARAIARPVGVDVAVERRGNRGHPHIVVTGPHGTRRWTVASSPRCADYAIYNVRKDIKRLIQEVM